MADYYENNLESDSGASASSRPINLELLFTDEVASPVFTREIISGKANKSIKVILVDTKTRQKVTTGPLASAKVKIVLVRGDYGGTTYEYGEFKKSIVGNWGKKKNLLQGGIYVDLKHGSGTVGKLRIKHDRNSLSNVKFRLGAMVVKFADKVKPAITDPFQVKDRRNMPKSLRSLSLTDSVCQLMNIQKKGRYHQRLQSLNVFTVRDFLNMYSSNPQALQEICRLKGKRLETTVNHAKTCLVQHVVTPGRVGSDTMSSFADDGNMEFDNNCYKPQPCEDNPFGNTMIEDYNFSIQDFEECIGDGIYGAWTMVGHGAEGKGIKAKKRWMKLRRLMFSITTLMKVRLGDVWMQP